MYAIRDRVVKISSPPDEKSWAAKGERGEVRDLKLPAPHIDRTEIPYIRVQWDSNNDEWCFENELVREDAYDTFKGEVGRDATIGDVTETLDGVQRLNLYPPQSATPQEIRGDGPVVEETAAEYNQRLGDSIQKFVSGMGELLEAQLDSPRTIKVIDPSGLPNAVDIHPDFYAGDQWSSQFTAPTETFNEEPIGGGEYVLEGQPDGGYDRVVYINPSALRKMQPVGTLISTYFPDGFRGASAVAWVGNEKHRPGMPLGWSRGVSDDHVDCIVRHLQDAAQGDGWDTIELPDGRIYQVRHASAAAWRALANAQLDAERVNGQVIRRLK